ncbi:Ubiquitin carboxyl-terminal hydrolase isozyme L3 [Eumeta japonica]|uniref:Ubiquitin carboxyl-terminal hydrolase n=1 Tax=Eumeta variegata TaxID=151549 RepID=A0A4C1XJ88_EUMVA|nr:Ubiquitin carboxyl-terminal hydrolase isozyme L3 [Eumeta japonica]
MTTDVLIPLESNPEVMNKFLQKLGVSSKWNIVDVMGLDPEMLSWVPQPVAAVMLLFPSSDAYEQHKKQEEIDILAKGQEVSNNIFFMKQNISNACGTIALVHSVANNTDLIELSDGIIKKFLDEAKGLDASARGALLEKSEGIINAHKELAQEGQTHTPSADEPVNHHFITFVQKDGSLYELDGRKAFPINHGSTTSDNFLEDAAKVCKSFMAQDPNEVRFTVVALVAAD